MCGKFTQLATWREVVAFSQPLTGEPIVATPMREAFIMRLNAQGAREMAPMRWGFLDGRSPRPKHMHARGETVDTLRTFAECFAYRRGILMVQTFNEGEELPSGKTKQWVITPKDGKPIAIAVIYDETDPLAFVQVTMPANALISRITDRMPAILAEADFAVWLGETRAPPAEVKALLRTFDDAGAWTMAPEPKGGSAVKQQPQLF